MCVCFDFVNNVVVCEGLVGLDTLSIGSDVMVGLRACTRWQVSASLASPMVRQLTDALVHYTKARASQPTVILHAHAGTDAHTGRDE